MSKIPQTAPEKQYSNHQGKTFKTKIVDQIAMQRLIRKHLYTKPIQTPVQEYLCNALDAMELSRRSNQPIKVYLPDLSDGIFRIRDFGPGLTDKQVENIYVNIGVSTKRKNKKAIGCWGYGSKAFFAYTSNFYVISYYNGIETTFLAKINPDDSSSFELQHKRETSEPNGLEVQCPVKDEDINKFCESVVRCCLFWKVQPILFGDAWKERAEKLLAEIQTPLFKTSTGRVFNFSSELNKILGVRENVIVNAGYTPYNLLDVVFDHPDINTLPKNSNSTLVLDFDIEALFIPPNRETLNENPENIDQLVQSYKNAITEYEEHFFSKIENFNSLTELQESAFEYKKFVDPCMRNFKNKPIEFNGKKYYIDKDYKLLWNCSELDFHIKKEKEKDNDSYGRRRSRKAVADFTLKKVEHLSYQEEIAAVVYIHNRGSERSNKTMIKKVLENIGESETSVFQIPFNSDRNHVLFTFNENNMLLEKKFNETTIHHLIHTKSFKWPKNTVKTKTLAKICTLDPLKADFWFKESTSDLEVLQDQIVEVFHKSYKLHYKNLGWEGRAAVMEFKKLHKARTGNDLEIYYISTGVEKKIQKLNITTKNLQEEMRKSLSQEDINFYVQPLNKISIPTILKSLSALSFVDQLGLEELTPIRLLIEQQESYARMEAERKARVLPLSLLRHFKYEKKEIEEVKEGNEIRDELVRKYPLFMRLIEHNIGWLEIESNELAKKQLISAWTKAIKGTL